MKKIIRLTQCEGDIVVELVSSGGETYGTITSSLQDDGELDAEWDAFVDGITSLILAAACEGIDIESSAFQTAVQTAIQAGAVNIP